MSGGTIGERAVILELLERVLKLEQGKMDKSAPEPPEIGWPNWLKNETREPLPYEPDIALLRIGRARFLRAFAHLKRLPDTEMRIRALEKQVQELSRGRRPEIG